MQSPPEAAEAPGSTLARFAPLLVLAAAAALVLAMGWQHELTLASLARRRDALAGLVETHFFLALIGFVGLYVLVVALSVPGATLLTVAGGVLFGWFIGGSAALIGATVGAILVFLVARHALGDFLQRKAGARLAALADGFKADAFSYLLFLRLVPLFPFWLVNLAPALLGVRLGVFALATLIGIIPGTFVFAFVGAGLDSVIGAQETIYRACVAAGRSDCQLDFNLRAAVTPQVLIALTAFGVLALLPIVLRRWRAARAGSA
jgi:uncharacterized membrane protein YdjX (TVP38/TMEM64 family)